MITFRGVFVVGVAAFAFLLARLTLVGWLYLLDAILWGAILLSVVVPWMAVSGLSVRRRLVRSGGNPGSPGPTEGEEVQIQLTLENPRAWSRYFLSLTYECPFAPPEERSQRMYVPRLASSSSLSLASEVECYRRGPYQLGPGDCGIPCPLRTIPKKTAVARPHLGVGLPPGSPSGETPPGGGNAGHHRAAPKGEGGAGDSGLPQVYAGRPLAAHPLAQLCAGRTAHGQGVRGLPGEYPRHPFRF